MGIAERRAREKAHRQASIIDAAEQVFFAKGVDGATMDEVAERAELSKGLLYFYFKSKTDLHDAICYRAHQAMRRAFVEASASRERGIEKVFAIGEAYVQFPADYPNYFAALAQHAAQEPSDDPTSFAARCDEEGENVLGVLADAIQHGIDDGSIRADVNPMLTAVMLWGQTMGLMQVAAYKHISDRHGVSLQALKDLSFQLIGDALTPKTL